jgi:hypothetical protein
MNELFQIEECKSPRLLWLEKHNVKHAHYPEEDKSHKFMAWMEDEKGNQIDLGCYGETLQEALCGMAEANKIPLWNEEEFAKKPLVN